MPKPSFFSNPPPTHKYTTKCIQIHKKSYTHVTASQVSIREVG